MSHRRRKKRRPNTPPEIPARPQKKIRSWTLPTVLGLALGVLGAVGIVELRPQPTALPQPPGLEKSQPFSVPFRIENSGYLSFDVEDVFLYVKAVTLSHVKLYGAVVNKDDWNHFELNRGDSRTISCNVVKSYNMPATADIIIVLDIRPFWWFPWSSRRYFRFVGAHKDRWQWLAQPSAPVQADADKSIRAYGRIEPWSP